MPVLVSKESFENLLLSKERNLSSIASSLLNDAKKRAKKRGGNVSLTHEWIVSKLQGSCEITGIPFQFEVENGHRHG